MSDRLSFHGLPSEKALIERSLKAYRRHHRRYERQHGEIFNNEEQRRLGRALERALGAVQSTDASPLVLDLGCGTGNLTRHLLSLKAEVIAGDISPHFLRAVERRYGSQGNFRTALLNGVDLREFDSSSLDCVAAYSVLHHVPDYLRLIIDAVRVLKPGGVIYLDHEANEYYWSPPYELSRFRSEVAQAAAKTRFWNPTARPWQRYLEPARYIHRLRRQLHPRYQIEGDIHVWPDDHIEWDHVETALRDAGADLLKREDYLLFRDGYPVQTHRDYALRCSDTRLLVYRKRREASSDT